MPRRVGAVFPGKAYAQENARSVAYLRLCRRSCVAKSMNGGLSLDFLGGRSGYFYFFFCSGEGEGESEVPAREGGGTVSYGKSQDGGGGFSRAGGGGGEGPRGCLRGIGGGGWGGLNVFFRGRNYHQVFVSWTRAFEEY